MQSCMANCSKISELIEVEEIKLLARSLCSQIMSLKKVTRIEAKLA